jgi:hypothetical protein
MSNNNVKNIVAKAYLSVDTFLDTKAKCDDVGISMSAGINLALRQWQPAHRIRPQGGGARPKTGPRRALHLPSSRKGQGGAPTPHARL